MKQISNLDGEFDIIAQVRSNAIAAVHLGHVEEDFSNNVGALDEPKIILQAVDHALNHVKWWLVIEENDYACGASKKCR